MKSLFVQQSSSSLSHPQILSAKTLVQENAMVTLLLPSGIFQYIQAQPDFNAVLFLYFSIIHKLFLALEALSSKTPGNNQTFIVSLF